MSVDPRARRVAVVSDSLLGHRLAELHDAGYGIIQLPPAGLPDGVTAEWLEQVAEHVEEFRRTGYEVAFVGDDADAELRARLAHLGAADLPDARLS